MADTLTERLAGLVNRPIDDAVRGRAALHLLDWVACAAAGATSKPGGAIIQYGLTRPHGACSALGAGRLDAASAAFVNGGLGNTLELDDVHRTSIMHAGDVVVPAALAAAQREKIDGRGLLDAMVKGYEAAIRIGMAAAAGGYAPWYNSSVCGTFGAAVAAGSVLKLDQNALIDALGQAGMQSSGVWQCRLEPTYSKQLATARAAESGIVSADLAHLGFPGARRILEGPLGFFAAFYPDAQPKLVVSSPDAPWKLLETSFKPWPACRHAHPVIEAGFALRGRGGNRVITKITVETYQSAIDFCDNARPKTETEAQFSLQHCMAIALINGKVSLSDFSPDAIAEPAVSNLREKVRVHAEEKFTRAFPSLYGAQVEVVYDNGHSEIVTVETARGDPENPMAENEIYQKFRDCLELAGVGAKCAEGLKTAISRLAGAKDLTSLSAHLELVCADISTHRQTE